MLDILQNKTRFLLVIFLLLVIGFFSISLFSYFASNQIIRQQVQDNELPLTSDVIYSEIKQDLVPSVLISQLMAQDTHLMKEVRSGESKPEEIVQYLKSIQEKFKIDTAFFISEKTRNYYHSSGVAKKLKEGSGDEWYFRALNLDQDYEINIDSDDLVKNISTIFVNHKVFDLNAELIGIIGVGVSSKKMYEKIQIYNKKFNRKVYFSDKSGSVVLGYNEGNEYRSVNISQTLKSIAPKVLSSEKGSYVYKKDGREIFLETRFIPELDWYLYVEKNAKHTVGLASIFWVSLLSCLMVSLFVLRLIRIVIKEYQSRLKTLATFDKRTGLKNRLGFDSVFDYAMKSSVVSNESLSVLLIDIDDFENIRAKYGAESGDILLMQFAEFLKGQSLCINLVCRRVGEEFLMVFPNFNLENITKRADVLSADIASKEFILGDQPVSITTSIGVASRIDGDSNKSIIKRVEKALKKAKEKGRNRVKSV